MPHDLSNLDSFAFGGYANQDIIMNLRQEAREELERIGSEIYNIMRRWFPDYDPAMA
jgi:hypothetical protein